MIGNLIKEDQTWHIQDSTKVQTYLDCPRLYFYQYVLGWNSAQDNIHFVFGDSWHRAMEYLLQNGYGQEALIEAQNIFRATYRAAIDPVMDESYYPKTPGFALEMLAKYCEQYQDDHREFAVKYLETSGSVSVDSKRVIYFKTDSILEDTQGRLLSLEHKTTSSASWLPDALSFQVGAYSHVLYCLAERPEDVYGIIINGAIFQKTKPGFMRLHYPKTKDQMQVWLWNCLDTLNQIEFDFVRLSECSEGDSVLRTFPMNTRSCKNYNKQCSYYQFCSHWPNPLQRLEPVPLGFERRFWDPQAIQTTNKLEIGV